MAKICCGIYRGNILVRNRNLQNSFFRSLGNAQLTLNQEQTDIEQESFTTLGGTECKTTYVSSVTLETILTCLSAENLAMAVLGTLSKLTGGTITDEEHEVNSIEAYIPFNQVPDRTQAITVKSEDGSETFVLGEDYALTNAGIRILENSSIPVDGTVIQVSYSYGTNYVIDALTLSQQDFEVIFDGFNAASADKTPVVIKFYNVRFSPAAAIALIAGQEFANLTLTGEVLKDDTRPSGSEFYTLTIGQPNDGIY